MKRILVLSLIISLSCDAGMEIKKVVIPAAGFGTRFLPATKAIPKEMIPLASKPAIQIIVEEAMASGISHIIPIISKHKQSIIDHFDPKRSEDLKTIGKYHMIAENDKKFEHVRFDYINQKIQLGLGHAVLLAQEVVAGEYFGVMLPDEIIFSDNDPALGQLIAIAQKEHASVIAVQEVPLEKVSSYGIVKIKKEISPGAYEIEDMVEKPAVDQAPSNLAIIGRYILSPKVFDSLNYLLERYTTGELQLTDAIAHMMKTTGERVIAYKVDGERHDIGVPAGWIKGVIASAYRDPRFKDGVLSYFQELLAKKSSLLVVE